MNGVFCLLEKEKWRKGGWKKKGREGGRKEGWRLTPKNTGILRCKCQYSFLKWTSTRTQFYDYMDMSPWEKLVLESNCMHAQLVSHVWLFTTQWDCSPPVFSVHGIFHARILEWAVISPSRVSSWPRGWNLIYISCICSQILYRWATSK